MMGQVHWIPARGEGRVERADSSPSLKAMQAWCAGFVEHVTVLYKGKRASMYVHDEGRIIGLPVNKAATEIYWAASRARGVEPSDQVEREADKQAFSERFKADFTVDLDTRPNDPPFIHGNAVLLEGISDG